MKKVGILSVVVLALLVTVPKGTGAGLRAELAIENSDIGIPGVTKMYQARLVNRSHWPISVQYCDFVDDAMSHGEEIAYMVQRWNEAKQVWETVVGADQRGFCKPYPLGIVRARISRKLLWPGQSLSASEEATAARDAFNIGDRARFVILTTADGGAGQFPSPEFSIDEHSTADQPMRVRH